MKEAASAPMHRPETNKRTIRTGKLVVNLDELVVSVDDQPVHLTGKEYGILELLSLRKGTTLTKEMILDHLYSEWTSLRSKSLTSLFASSGKNLPGRPAEVTTSRRCGAAAMSSGIRPSPRGIAAGNRDRDPFSRGQVRDYLDATGAPEGLLVFVTTDQLVRVRPAFQPTADAA
jgi:hypothetical protein